MEELLSPQSVRSYSIDATLASNPKPKPTHPVPDIFKVEFAMPVWAQCYTEVINIEIGGAGGRWAQYFFHRRWRNSVFIMFCVSWCSSRTLPPAQHFRFNNVTHCMYLPTKLNKNSKVTMTELNRIART